MTVTDPASRAVAAPGDGVLARVRARLPEFTGALLRVAERVLADPAAAARATIVELAEQSGTSPATITRFCRALGFDGYPELRLGIAGETGRAARAAGWSVDIGRAIQPTDPLDRVLGQVVAADTLAMHDTVALLDLGQVAAAAAAIAGAARTDIYGASGSALVGAELQLSLHRIGVPAWAWSDVHSGLASAAVLAAGDVALGISHTGQTRETTEMLAEASGRGATTIALTSVPRSPLAEVADLVLTTAPIPVARLASPDRPGRGDRAGGDRAGGEGGRGEGGRGEGGRGERRGGVGADVRGDGDGGWAATASFRPDALSARHPQLVVLDLLYIAVAQRIHDRAHAAFQRTARAVEGHRAPVAGAGTGYGTGSGSGSGAP